MINKPPHNRFLLSASDEDQYWKLAARYQKAKKYGIRAAFVIELGEDTQNISYLPIDLIFFGQAIPIGETNRFNLLTNVQSLF